MSYNHCIYRPLNQKRGKEVIPSCPGRAHDLGNETNQMALEKISLGSYKARGHQVPGHLLCDSWANLLIKKVMMY